MRITVLAITASIFLPCFAVAATPVDGVYKGSDLLSGSRNRRCPPGVKFSVRVRNGVFVWMAAPDERSMVQIAPDGSFSAQNGRRFMQGRIENSTLTAHTTGEYCDYDWSLAR